MRASHAHHAGHGNPHSHERYDVDCSTCRAPFDALVAAWCRCLVSERSLACPGCGACFCRATPAYVRAFWAGAPPVLRAAKLWENAVAIPESVTACAMAR